MQDGFSKKKFDTLLIVLKFSYKLSCPNIVENFLAKFFLYCYLLNEAYIDIDIHLNTSIFTK